MDFCYIMEKVTILWKGPHSVTSAIEQLRNDMDFGIYLITRKWGNAETLLYIGLVYWRCFAERIADHRREWLYDLRGFSGIRVRIGRIRLGSGKIHSIERAEDIECLLIYVHQPQENTQCISSYNGRELKIINLGRKGPLEKEIYSENYR